MENIINAIKAGYCYIYVQSQEVDKAYRNIYDNIKSDTKLYDDIYFWDFSPVYLPDGQVDVDRSALRDPEKVLEYLNLPIIDFGHIIVAKNFNWFLKDKYDEFNKDFVSFLQRDYELFTSSEGRKTLIIVSDEDFTQAIPLQLQNLFFVDTYSLPDKKEVKAILDEIIEAKKEDPKFKKPTKKDQGLIVGSATGLTTIGIENALAYSLVANEGKFDSRMIAEIRGKEISSTPGLSLGNFDNKFNSLEGMDYVKSWFKTSYESDLAKGIILIGPPGTGKTTLGKCCAGETQRTFIIWELAQMSGEGLVGQAENAMNKALQVTKVNAPNITFIDELEKGMAGSSTKNLKNGGSGSFVKSNSQFLKFLSDDRPPGCYIIATCNSIRGLDPEWLRAGRWDCAPFYIGLPSESQQKKILNYYSDLYKVTGKPTNMDGWSGAEIETACKLAAMSKKKISDVDNMIRPISKMMKEELKELEDWASTRAIDATTGKRPDTSSKQPVKMDDKKLKRRMKL